MSDCVELAEMYSERIAELRSLFRKYISAAMIGNHYQIKKSLNPEEKKLFESLIEEITGHKAYSTSTKE